MCGAIGFVQRFGSLLNLNCHFHNLLPDGVFVLDRNGAIQFQPLPPPWKDDVQRLLKQIARGTEKLVAKRSQSFENETPDRLVQEQAKSFTEKNSDGTSWPQADNQLLKQESSKDTPVMFSTKTARPCWPWAWK